MLILFFSSVFSGLELYVKSKINKQNKHWLGNMRGGEANKKIKETRKRTKTRNDHVRAEKGKFANLEG